MELRQKNLRVYSKNAIQIGTFFFGPMAGGYMMLKNFELFENHRFARNAQITLIGGITILILYLLLGFPLPPQWEVLFPIFSTIIANQFFVSYQEKESAQYLKEGGKRQTVWKIFSVCLLSLLTTVLYVIFLSFLVGAFIHR